MDSPELYGKSQGWLPYPPQKVHSGQKKAINKNSRSRLYSLCFLAVISCIFFINQDNMVIVLGMVTDYNNPLVTVSDLIGHT